MGLEVFLFAAGFSFAQHAVIPCVSRAVGRPIYPRSYCPSTGCSYEKDEMQTELFGIDDDWTKQIYFDRAKLTPEEQRKYPDLKKPPPWIDIVSSQTHTLKHTFARRLLLPSRSLLWNAGLWQTEKGAHACLWH